MQPNSRLNPALAVLLLVATLLGGGLVAPAPAAAQQQAPQDWDILGGHFFTQTGKGNQSGFALTDDNGVAFWSEFKRLGGVNVLGYPVSRRFLWNGFVCQAMQRVVLQWDKDAKAANFVNVFDLMHDTGKDAWLETVRQTPKPKAFNEGGLGWEQIVQQRLAVLEANPAIKRAYFAVVGGDPVTMNGLPTTDVVDMGDNFIVRAQRVVIQQWKKDVPWAKAGQVTFGLGGSIAVESGLLPVATAGDPEVLLVNNERKFRVGYPHNWQPSEYEGWVAVFESSAVENGVNAGIAIDIDTLQNPPTLEQAAASLNSQASRDRLRDGSKLNNFYIEVPKIVQFGDRTYVKQIYGGTTPDGLRIKEARYAFFIGNVEYWFSSFSSEGSFPRHEGTFDWIVSTIQPIP